MTHHPQLLAKKHKSIPYRAAFPYAVLGAMVVALFLVYIVVSASMTSASFTYDQLQVKKQQLLEDYRDLSYGNNLQTSLARISEAAATLGLEEIRYAVYIDLNEPEIVAKK